MITAFALNRLDKDGRYLVRRGHALENRFLDLCHTATAEIRHLPDLGAAGIRNVMNIGDEWRKAAAMDQFGARQRHGAVGSSVERTEKSDGARASCVPAHKLQRCLKGFCAAVGEEHALGRLAGC